MKVQEIRKIDTEKLQTRLGELRQKTRELRFNIANNQLKNVREARVAKKDIAKIMTVLKERDQASVAKR